MADDAPFDGEAKATRLRLEALAERAAAWPPPQRALLDEAIAESRSLAEELAVARAKLAEGEGRVRRDTTDRKKAEEALRESEEKFRRLFAAVSDAIIVFDAETRQFVDVNEAALQLYGYTREEFLALRHSAVTAEPERSEVSIRAALAGTLTRFPLRYHRKKDGTLFAVEISASTSEMGNRRVLCGVVRDITQRLQLEAELLAISQRERRRIGRDLHDSVGQQLAALVFAVASLQNKLAARALPEAADAENLVGLLKKVTAELRSLARGLCPVELKADGLMIALGGLAHSAGSQFGVACTFESDNPVPVHDHTVATHLYRIAQEGLTNAVKHGKAGQVVIRLTASEDQIVLAIEDNGVGIPMPWEQSEGLGLHIMNHRAGILGAALTVQRRAEGGTRVTCLLPRQRAMKPEGRPHDAQ